MFSLLPLLIPTFLLVPVYFIGRTRLVKRYKEKYELSLIHGDADEAKKLGNVYYHLLSKEVMEQKGITDIEDKIQQEFLAYNS